MKSKFVITKKKLSLVLQKFLYKKCIKSTSRHAYTYYLCMYIYISYKFIGLAVLEIQTFLKIDISEKSIIEWLKTNKKMAVSVVVLRYPYQDFAKTLIRIMILVPSFSRLYLLIRNQFSFSYTYLPTIFCYISIYLSITPLSSCS